ncbi:MAG: ATP-grasp domain-containing protein [Porticoccaceae bacterium]
MNEKQPMETGTVLILDGDTVPALAIARSLGRQGIPVDIASHQLSPISEYSRFVGNTHLYPHPLESNHQFLAWLEQQLSGNRYRLIIPATERTLVPIARHFQNHPQADRITMPALEALETVLDKARTTQLAVDCNVPQPQSWTISQMSELSDLEDRLHYPVVVKPGRSISDNEVRVPLTVRYAHSWEELVKIGHQLLEHVHLVLQEYFSGIGVGIELIACRGKILYAFQHQRIHEMPLTGGGSSYRKSVEIDPQLLEASSRLIAHLNWHGVAMVEFKKNPRTGEFILIEINGRFWGSLPLATAAGADFPYQLYQLYTSGTVTASNPYRREVYCRKLASDLAWLEAVVRRDADTRLVSIPSIGSAIKDWLKIFSRHHYFDVQSSQDLKPGLVDIGHIINNYLERIFGIFRERAFRKKIIKRSHHRNLVNKLYGARNILFICYGNINRSAIAHVLADNILPDRGLHFRSAGFHPEGQRPADQRMVAIATEQGIPMEDFRSTSLTQELADWADLIFVMEAAHVTRLAELSEQAAAKAYLLGGLIIDSEACEIADPYNQPEQIYQATYQKVAQCLAGMKTMLAINRTGRSEPST